MKWGDWSFDRVQISVKDINLGLVKMDFFFSGQPPSEITCSISFDENNQFQNVLLKLIKGKASLELKVPHPQFWAPESPHLHTISFQTSEDDIIERFGFRTVKVEGDKILLNGAPIKLLGYCRHETHLQFGPALSLAQIIQDLQILKDLNCNFVRGSHYPQDQRFLDLCDELGFLVFEESLGWGNRPEFFADPNFCNQQEEQTRLMIRKSFNHPCVII